MKCFAIRPIRGIAEDKVRQYQEFIQSYRNRGYEIYDPYTDTDQKDETGLRICRDNLQAVKKSDAVIFIWDGKSQGSLFDLGMSFALGKKLITDESMLPELLGSKSYQDMAIAWRNEEDTIG